MPLADFQDRPGSRLWFDVSSKNTKHGLKTLYLMTSSSDVYVFIDVYL